VRALALHVQVRLHAAILDGHAGRRPRHRSGRALHGLLSGARLGYKRDSCRHVQAVARREPRGVAWAHARRSGASGVASTRLRWQLRALQRITHDLGPSFDVLSSTRAAQSADRC
jgi:hypothetical protein